MCYIDVYYNQGYSYLYMYNYVIKRKSTVTPTMIP